MVQGQGLCLMIRRVLWGGLYYNYYHYLYGRLSMRIASDANRMLPSVSICKRRPREVTSAYISKP